MPKTLKTLLEYVHGALLLSTLMVLFMGITTGGQMDTDVFIRCLSILLPFVVSGIAEAKCKGLPAFLLCCILSVIPVWFISPSEFHSVILVIVSIVIVGARIIARLSHTKDFLSSPHYAWILYFLIMYAISVMAEAAFACTFVYYAAFAYILIIALYMNRCNLDEYISNNSSVKNIPINAIRRSNNGAFLGMLALITCSMILIPRSGIEVLINEIGHLLLAFIRWIFSLFKDIPEDTYEELAGQTGSAMDLSGIASGSAPEWLIVLWKILEYGVMAFAVIIILLIGYGIYQLVKNFYRPDSENNDETEFITPLHETTERVSSSRSGTILKNLFNQDPTESVRRAYVKTIQKFFKKLPENEKKAPEEEKKTIGQRLLFSGRKKLDHPEFTPTEVESYVRMEESSERETLHKLYEKARYSNSGCSKEDAANIKKLQSSLNR